MSASDETGDFRVLQANADPGNFLRDVRRADTRLLLLDYDGTLAPFTPERDRAFPYPGVRELLTRILADERNRVVVISGRAVADLIPLLGIDPLPEIWGSHGWEHRMADGTYRGPAFPDGLAELFAAEWKWLQEHIPRQQLERKPASVAVHWRGVGDKERERIRAAAEKRWAAFEERDLLDLHAFDGGLELRAAGKTKGDAVHALLHDLRDSVPAAYLGDDKTDEDAFSALEGRGLRVLVRRELRPTQADVHLIPPEELLRFLTHWTESA